MSYQRGRIDKNLKIHVIFELIAAAQPDRGVDD